MLLHAQVIEAKDLPELDDPNVFVSLLIDEIGQEFKTEKITSQNPTWNQEVDLKFTHQDSAILKVKVYNEDIIDEKIGKVLIPINSIPNLSQESDQWYQIKNKAGEVTGSIHLKLKVTQTDSAKSDSDPLNIHSDNENNFEATKCLVSFTVLSLEGADQLSEMKISDCTPDFYTTLQIEGHKREERTVVKIGNLRPTWEQTFNFHVEAKGLTVFDIKVHDHQVKKDTDVTVAECKFPLSDIPNGTNDYDSWLELNSVTNANEKCRLHVKIHLEPTEELSDDEENTNDLEIRFDKNNLFPERVDLYVTVVEAHNLPKVESGGADPYCVVKINDNEQKTNVISNELNPVWNKPFFFSIENRSEAILSLTVIDDNKVMKDKDIAKIDIPIASFTEMTDKWYDLQPFKKIKKGGKIHIIVKTIDPSKSSTTTTKSITQSQQVVQSQPVSTQQSTTSTTTTTTTTSSTTKTSTSTSQNASSKSITTPEINNADQNDEIGLPDSNSETGLPNSNSEIGLPNSNSETGLPDSNSETGLPDLDSGDANKDQNDAQGNEEPGLDPEWVIDELPQETNEASQPEGTEEAEAVQKDVQPPAPSQEPQPEATEKVDQPPTASPETKEPGLDPDWIIDEPPEETKEPESGSDHVVNEPPQEPQPEKEEEAEKVEQPPAASPETKEPGLDPDWIVNEPPEEKSQTKEAEKVDQPPATSQETKEPESVPDQTVNEPPQETKEPEQDPDWIINEPPEATKEPESVPDQTVNEPPQETKEPGLDPDWTINEPPKDTQEAQQPKEAENPPTPPQETKEPEQDPDWIINESPEEAKEPESVPDQTVNEPPQETKEPGLDPDWTINEPPEEAQEKTEKENQPSTPPQETKEPEQDPDWIINMSPEETEEEANQPPATSQETKSDESNPNWVINEMPPSKANKENQQHQPPHSNVDNTQNEDDDQSEEFREIEEEEEEANEINTSQQGSPRSPKPTQKRRLDRTLTDYIKYKIETEPLRSPSKSVVVDSNNRSLTFEEEEIDEPEEEAFNYEQQDEEIDQQEREREREIRQQQEEELNQKIQEKKKNIKETVKADAPSIYNRLVISPLKEGFLANSPRLRPQDRLIFSNSQKLSTLKEKTSDPNNMSLKKLQSEIAKLTEEIGDLNKEIDQLDFDINNLKRSLQ